MNQNRLEIRRFRARYFVARDQPLPARVKDLLDDAAKHSLTESLSGLLSRCFSDGDPTVCLIRRLDLSLDVNCAWDKHSLSRVWARELGRNLESVLRDGADGHNVVRFPSRAAYLSCFLCDLAAGRAWSRWYYDMFSGLRLLPASSALRTAVCDDPAVGLAALHRLPSRQLGEVLEALTAEDASEVLDAIASADAAADAASCRAAARDAWERLPLDSTGPQQAARRALGLYVEARRDRQAGGLQLKSAAMALSRLRPTPTIPQFESSVPGGARYTPFGGAFLLLPLINDLPIAEATAGWPDLEDATAAVVARFLLLVKCCGRARAASAFHDPLLRDVSAVAPSISVSLLAAWQKKISAGDRETFRTTLADWHERSGGPAPDHFASRDKLRGDLSYLASSKSLGLARPIDWMLGHAARAVMRLFATRLPGFTTSNLNYLYNNFLDFSARHEEEIARRVVRLERPPLHLILSMTGMTRQQYRLNWLDERPFTLFSAE